MPVRWPVKTTKNLTSILFRRSRANFITNKLEWLVQLRSLQEKTRDFPCVVMVSLRDSGNPTCFSLFYPALMAKSWWNFCGHVSRGQYHLPAGPLPWILVLLHVVTAPRTKGSLKCHPRPLFFYARSDVTLLPTWLLSMRACYIGNKVISLHLLSENILHLSSDQNWNLVSAFSSSALDALLLSWPRLASKISRETAGMVQVCNWPKEPTSNPWSSIESHAIG